MRSSPTFGACGNAGATEAISANSAPPRNAIAFDAIVFDAIVFIVIPPSVTYFLFVVFGRELEGRALRRIVIDPELRLVLGEEIGNAPIRRHRLLPVEVV